ncbi:hypothetical protein [Alicyclobacillus macrosporangiidus]|uniref:hypothetical protein n=1 Tax=Alicyclobacillus macrosporangiidus TaxID=392015 RepID=UPI000497651D|nr:hypothetical protein [Alicyclobacillus macrosporangiidus]
MNEMGEWTWLFTRFPLADMELVAEPMDPRIANVLVRTLRRLPDDGSGEGPKYEVRVAPHNVAPFRGGPWLRTFTERELEQPGAEIARFRADLLSEIARCKGRSGETGEAR